MMKKELNEMTVGKTTTLFQDDVDYTKASEDRPIKWKLEDGHVVYLNLEQRRFLTRQYFNDVKREEREKRCVIPSVRKGMVKKCRSTCSECPYFQNGKTAFGTVSLDELRDRYEWEPEDDNFSLYEKKIHKQQRQMMYDAITKLKDEKDKTIINSYLDGFTPTEIAQMLKTTTSTIYRRIEKIIKEIKEILKIS